MAETVKLYGGPRDGEEHPLPFERSSAIQVEAIFNVDGKRFIRRGRYTRVHDISGKPSADFEWAGYTTAFIPSEPQS